MRHWIILTCVAGTAAADTSPPDDDAKIEEIIGRLRSAEAQRLVRSAVQRARRAIAIGPTVGAWGAFEPSPTSGDGAITIGLGAELFDVPVVPELDDIKEIVLDKTKHKLKERLFHLHREHLEEIAKEVYEETKAEVLAELNRAPETFEKPRVTVALEFDRLFHADVWQARLRLGVGISRVTIGATTAYGFGDESFHLGPEITVHALLSDGPRTPVVDGFVRYDFELAHRDHNTDMIVVGARFLLDAI